MVPYFGGYSARLFIYRKTIHFGYKLWSLCSSDSYPYNLIIYNRCNNTKPVHVGLGKHIIKSLVGATNNPKQYEFYFVNFFTFFGLMSQLTKAVIYITGIIRPNCIERCPLYCEKELKKDDRGMFDYHNNNLVLIY